MAATTREEPRTPPMMRKSSYDPDADARDFAVGDEAFEDDRGFYDDEDSEYGAAVPLRR
jgi:hypothetical protein